MTLHVENLVDNASLPYGLALLRGSVSHASCSDGASVRVRVVHPTNVDTEETAWPIVGGRFQAFVPLVVGVNVVQLRCEGTLRRQMRIIRTTKTTSSCHGDDGDYHHVLPLYVVCADDDGCFQAPAGMDNDVEAACDRIRLATQMLQLFYAETLHAEGLGRKTFRLKEDHNGRIKCRTFRTKLCRKEAQAMTGKQLWQHLGCELVTARPAEKDFCKYLAFLSCTEYQNPGGTKPEGHHAVLELTKGHAALGGGGLALFGTGCLYTWPRHPKEIISCFTDVRCVDTTRFMDDSAGRGTHWACHSTSLGAVCHELGHAFDLGHDPHGIMARGFDDIVDFFVFPELFQYLTRKGRSNYSADCDENFNLDHGNRKASPPENRLVFNVPLCEKVFWHRPSVVILANHRWLNSSSTNEVSLPYIEGFIIKSANPLRIVQLRNAQGMSIGFKEFSESQPDAFAFHLNTLVSSSQTSDTTNVVVEDSFGNLTKATLALVTKPVS